MVHRVCFGCTTDWTGIISQRKTDLVTVHGSVTARSYLRDIIEPIIIPQFRQHPPNFLFMDDNAPPHRGRIVTARQESWSGSYGMAIFIICKKTCLLIYVLGSVEWLPYSSM